MAHEIAENHLKNIEDVFYNFIPDENKIAFEERYSDGYHTIWECYSPEFTMPASRLNNTFYSRQDFAGWSGLGSIALLIENIIGIEARGSRNKIIWRIRREDRHGVKNFNFKGDKINLMCNPKPDEFQFSVKCRSPFDLIIKIDNKEITKKIDYGNTAFSILR